MASYRYRMPASGYEFVPVQGLPEPAGGAADLRGHNSGISYRQLGVVPCFVLVSDVFPRRAYAVVASHSQWQFRNSPRGWHLRAGEAEGGIAGEA